MTDRPQSDIHAPFPTRRRYGEDARSLARELAASGHNAGQISRRLNVEGFPTNYVTVYRWLNPAFADRERRGKRKR